MRRDAFYNVRFKLLLIKLILSLSSVFVYIQWNLFPFYENRFPWKANELINYNEEKMTSLLSSSLTINFILLTTITLYGRHLLQAASTNSLTRRRYNVDVQGGYPRRTNLSNVRDSLKQKTQDGFRSFNVGVLMASKLDSPFDLERCGPAVDLALDEINEKFLKKYRIRLTKVQGRFVIDNYHRHLTSFFIYFDRRKKLTVAKRNYNT